MLKDWNIGADGHSGYGKWQIDQKSASEFETVASHCPNVKFLSLPLADLADPALMEKVESIDFSCKVQGVGPNFADKYQVKLELL